MDVARAYGYKDRSAISQIRKQLLETAEVQPTIPTRMARLQKRLAKNVWGIKS